MAIVNLGNIKHAPVFKIFNEIKHVWSDEERVGSSIKIDIPFVFSKNKTYLVLIRSYSGKVTTEDGAEISVKAIKLLTNRFQGVSLSGGQPFKFLNLDYSFGITFPTSSATGDLGVYIVRPEETDAVSLFNVGIYEL